MGGGDPKSGTPVGAEGCRRICDRELYLIFYFFLSMNHHITFHKAGIPTKIQKYRWIRVSRASAIMFMATLTLPCGCQ